MKLSQSKLKVLEMCDFEACTLEEIQEFLGFTKRWTKKIIVDLHKAGLMKSMLESDGEYGVIRLHFVNQDNIGLWK